MVHTFELSELTEETLGQVVFYDLFVSTGLGGPGMLRFLIDDGQDYMIGFDGLEESEREFLSRFPPIKACLSSKTGNSNRFTQVENWLYCYLQIANYVFVREDFAEQFIPALEAHLKKSFIDCLKVAKKLLDPENSFQTKVFSQTAEFMRKREEEERKSAEQRESVRLRSEDIVWHEYAPNNQISDEPWGCYSLLLRECKGQIRGQKWTIQYQRKQYRECVHEANAPIEAYNLFCKDYRNMGGRLEYPAPNAEMKITYTYSTLDDGCHEPGRFVRSYQTLDAAKNAVLERSAGFDRTNILRLDYASMTEEAIKADYLRAVGRKMELQRKFPGICTELLQILATHDNPGDAFPEICEKLSLSQEDVRLIWEFFDPWPFCGAMLDD